MRLLHVNFQMDSPEPVPDGLFRPAPGCRGEKDRAQASAAPCGAAGGCATPRRGSAGLNVTFTPDALHFLTDVAVSEVPYPLTAFGKARG